MSFSPLSFFGNISTNFQNFYNGTFVEDTQPIGMPSSFQQGNASLQSSLRSYRMSTLSSRSLIPPAVLSMNHREKLEHCVSAVVAKLLSKNGELLMQEFIFRIPASQEKIAELKRILPADPSEIEDINDPHLLACFLKTLFATDADPLSQQIEFLPRTFTSEDFARWTLMVQENPQVLKAQLSILFSKQSDCVKFFILLIKRTSELKEYNRMTVEALAKLITPFLTAHFSLHEQYCYVSAPTLAAFIIQQAEEIFSEMLPIFNKFAQPVLKRVEDTIHAAIDVLSANGGELLKKEEFIFGISPEASKIKWLQKVLPDRFAWKRG